MLDKRGTRTTRYGPRAVASGKKVFHYLPCSSSLVQPVPLTGDSLSTEKKGGREGIKRKRSRKEEDEVGKEGKRRKVGTRRMEEDDWKKSRKKEGEGRGRGDRRGGGVGGGGGRGAVGTVVGVGLK